MPAARSSLLTGILITVFVGFLFAGMDTIGKHLTSLLPVLQIVWGRYLFQTVFVAGYLTATSGPGFLRTRHPVLQILRGLCLLGSTLLMYQALTRVPLADATAVIFFTPILVTLMSVLVLKETIGIHRISAIATGFIGMLLIIQPGFEVVDPFLFLALGAAFFNSVYLMMTRHLSGTADSASTRFNTTAVGAMILTVVIIPLWEPISPGFFALLVLIGGLGAIGHSLLVRAFALASASLLSPFLYSQVLGATIFSALILGDPLRPLMLVGTAILVASGIYIWWREQRPKLPTP